MRFRTAALSAVPGAAHIDLGRAKRGLLLFFLFAFSLNAAFVAPLVWPIEALRPACGLAAAGFWALALADAARLDRIARRGGRRAGDPPPAPPPENDPGHA